MDFLPRLPGEYGMWLALTGARLKGSDVTAIGVGTHHVPAEMIGHLVSQIETADFTFEPDNLLKSILSPLHKTVPDAECEAYESVINSCFSADSVEGIIEALKAVGSDWALAQVKALETKSPQTLKVAFRQIRTGKELQSFEDNMKME